MKHGSLKYKIFALHVYNLAKVVQSPRMYWLITNKNDLIKIRLFNMSK